ncbi:MAG: hypothetical protein II819_06700 [Fibrobacter sp.]|nr:hypothetical protein [Fibrobacter sp.]
MSKQKVLFLLTTILSFSSAAFGQIGEPLVEEQQPTSVEQAPASEPVVEQSAIATKQPGAVESQPVYAEQTPVAAQQQDSAQEAPVQPYVEPAPAYEPPQQTYVQGYGKPPEGFYGYFGYAPPAENSNAGCCYKEADSTAKKEEKKDYKSLQSFNFSVPIQSETYGLKSPDYDVDASHFGFGINWNRVRVEESLYSSVVGLGISYIMSEWDGGGKKNIEFNGLDANFKFGFGISPLTDRFILAIHMIFAFDYKMQKAVFKKKLGDFQMFQNLDMPDEISRTNLELKYTAHNLDLELGGDLVIGYQFTKSFGVLAGVDITSNMIGVGALMSSSDAPDGLEDSARAMASSQYSNYSDEIKELEAFSEGDDIRFFLYNTTGLNIVPRIGIFFAF